ncbi:MAG: branched-chain amino acid ABC transporter permease [Actinomycetota bacterium]|nr:branched-chain amino acid ABC transporter permease [Actinomycetota bacterium]MDQ2697395.1 branched-chain amino acid ABC transporter permease [Actinomycetota bacterium]
MSRTRRAALLAVVGAVAIALPYVAPSYYVSIATLVLGSAVLAAAVNMLVGEVELFSLGHAGIAAAAAYGLAWASGQGYDYPGQLLVALGMTVLASVIYGLISMRTTGVFFLMVTLAAGMVCFGMAYRWSSVTGGDNGITGIRRPPFVAEYWQFYFLVLVALLVVTFALYRLSVSPLGLTLRGIRDSQSRMQSLGYRVAAYKFTAVVMSGMVAGLAGVLLVWHHEFISPAFAGFQASALALVMVVLGGAGRLYGPLVGAAIVVLIQQVLSTYVERWPTVLGVIFILAVIVVQRGYPARIREALRRRRATSTTSEHMQVSTSTEG